MQHAVYLPPFGELADPHVLVQIAQAAEERGFDGLFLWDHVLSPVPGEFDIADAWVALAAVAVATTRIRLGPMVTPLPRRRVITVARETVTLDRLSGGRLTLGLGIGSDTGREYSAFGESTDARRHGRILDEATAALAGLWAGETVSRRGEITVDAVRATPGPLQQPRIPIWLGTTRSSGAPIDRAAHYDGVFPLEVGPDGVRRILNRVNEIRGHTDGFDVAVVIERDTDPGPLRDAGATWAMHSFWPGHTRDQVVRFVGRGVPG